MHNNHNFLGYGNTVFVTYFVDSNTSCRVVTTTLDLERADQSLEIDPAYGSKPYAYHMMFNQPQIKSAAQRARQSL